jgi:hypothetical protein
MEKLLSIQYELKCNKSQYNSFGKYKYRNCEDILEAVKPLCKKYNCSLVISDTIELIGDRYYVKATATLYDCETKQQIVMTTAYAREEAEKKGMDGSQVTGASSSYARKYALNGLFNIDDTKDSDTEEYQTKPDATNHPTAQQVATIKKLYTTEQIKAMLGRLNVAKLEDITLEQASEMIKRGKK